MSSWDGSDICLNADNSDDDVNILCSIYVIIQQQSSANYIVILSD